MVATGDDGHAIGVDGVDQTTGVIYTARPEAGEIFCQWFRFANASKRRPFGVNNKANDSFEGLFVSGLPIQVIVPRCLCPTQQSLTHKLALHNSSGFELGYRAV